MRRLVPGAVLTICLLVGSPARSQSDAGPWPGPVLGRPELLSDPPRPAPGTRIHGTVTVRCRVLVSGRLEDCVVVTGDGKPAHPAIIEMIASWAPAARLKPATSDGKPVEIPYVFNFNYR